MILTLQMNEKSNKICLTVSSKRLNFAAYFYINLSTSFLNLASRRESFLFKNLFSLCNLLELSKNLLITASLLNLSKNSLSYTL